MSASSQSPLRFVSAFAKTSLAPLLVLSPQDPLTLGSCGVPEGDRSEGENPAPHSGTVQARDGGKPGVANRRSVTIEETTRGRCLRTAAPFFASPIRSYRHGPAQARRHGEAV